MDIGGGGDEAVDSSAFPVNSDMNLHPEVVLIPLLRGVHVGVPLLLPVLRRRRGVDDGGVHDGPLGEFQPSGFKMSVDLLEDPLTKVVGLKKMAEFADGGLVGYRLVAKVYANKAPHGFHVVKGFFCPRIAEVKPALQKMDSKHSLQTYRGTTFARFGVEGFNESTEFLPGNDPLHFREELFPPCGLLVFLECGGVRKRFLAVHQSSSPRMVWSKKQSYSVILQG